MTKRASTWPATGNRRPETSSRWTPWTWAIGLAVANAVVALGWFHVKREEGVPPLTQTPVQQNSDGDDVLGPQAMSQSTPLLNKLLAMLKGLERLVGDKRQAEARRVWLELEVLEAALDVSTAAGKNDEGILSLVRAALKKDLGESDDWTDDALDRHGVVTYATPKYWEDAFSHNKYGESHDWYGAWDRQGLNGSLGDIVRPLLSREFEILVLGCGNSNMSALMYAEGYESITNVDVAESVISAMRVRHAHMPRMTWLAMDATALAFESRSFDIVIEKGLFDALYAGAAHRVATVRDEMRRVLRPGGRIISVMISGGRISEFVRDGNSDRAPLDCEPPRALRYREREDPIHVYSCHQA